MLDNYDFHGGRSASIASLTGHNQSVENGIYIFVSDAICSMSGDFIAVVGQQETAIYCASSKCERVTLFFLNIERKNNLG